MVLTGTARRTENDNLSLYRHFAFFAKILTGARIAEAKLVNIYMFCLEIGRILIKEATFLMVLIHSTLPVLPTNYEPPPLITINLLN